MIYTDKSTLVSRYVDTNAPADILSVVALIVDSMERTPIYAAGNLRSAAPALLFSAQNRIGARLANSGLDFQFEIFPDQEIYKTFPGIASNDRIDLLIRIVMNGVTYNAVIELDAARADQIAKKFASRAALLKNQNLIYATFCYPGRKSMDRNEALKYLEYMRTLSEALAVTAFVGLAPPRNWHK